MKTTITAQLDATVAEVQKLRAALGLPKWISDSRKSGKKTTITQELTEAEHELARLKSLPVPPKPAPAPLTEAQREKLYADIAARKARQAATTNADGDGFEEIAPGIKRFTR